MRFSGNWNIVVNIATITNGIVVNANFDSFQVANLSSNKTASFSRINFVSAEFKYRCEILSILQKSVDEEKKEKNLYLTPSAADFVDELCEANRLLF